MRRKTFWTKSFVLGLGIGLFSLSIIFLFGFFAFLDEYKELQISEINDEIIINRAKELGMTFTAPDSGQPIDENGATDGSEDSDPIDPPSDFLSSNEPNLSVAGQNAAETDTSSLSPDNAKTPINGISDGVQDKLQAGNNTEEQPKTVTIRITSTMKSDNICELLYKNNLIDNADDLNNYLKEKKVEKKLLTGVFEIPEGSAYDDIISIIVK